MFKPKTNTWHVNFSKIHMPRDKDKEKRLVHSSRLWNRFSFLFSSLSKNCGLIKEGNRQKHSKK